MSRQLSTAQRPHWLLGWALALLLPACGEAAATDDSAAPPSPEQAPSIDLGAGPPSDTAPATAVAGQAADAPPALSTSSAASGVTFSWPEADPGQGECLPGRYEGTFQCEMTFAGFLPSGPITGPVTFTLDSAQNGELLSVSDGRLEGTSGFTTFSCDLAGELSCASNIFHADAVNGTYPGGTFEGQLDGELNRLTQTLSGVWNLGVPGQEPCLGAWTVTRAP